jgi:hypothetical protein
VSGAAAEPAFRVVKGDPTPEELAALVAVLLLRGTAAAPAPPQPASTWAARTATLRGRVPWSPGPDGWRASSR